MTINIAVMLASLTQHKFIVVVRPGSDWPWLIHLFTQIFRNIFSQFNIFIAAQRETESEMRKKKKAIKYFNPFSFSMKNISFMVGNTSETTIVGVQSKYYFCAQLHYCMKYCLFCNFFVNKKTFPAIASEWARERVEIGCK